MIVTVKSKCPKITRYNLALLYNIDDDGKEVTLKIVDDLQIRFSKRTGIEWNDLGILLDEIAKKYWLRRTQDYFEKFYKDILEVNIKMVELGYLKIGDIFYFNGQQYKATSVGNRDVNNVCCVNIKTKKKVWLDVSTEVGIGGEKG